MNMNWGGGVLLMCAWAVAAPTAQGQPFQTTVEVVWEINIPTITDVLTDSERDQWTTKQARQTADRLNKILPFWEFVSAGAVMPPVQRPRLVVRIQPRLWGQTHNATENLESVVEYQSAAHVPVDIIRNDTFLMAAVRDDLVQRLGVSESLDMIAYQFFGAFLKNGEVAQGALENIRRYIPVANGLLPDNAMNSKRGVLPIARRRVVHLLRAQTCFIIKGVATGGEDLEFRSWYCGAFPTGNGDLILLDHRDNTINFATDRVEMVLLSPEIEPPGSGRIPKTAH